MPSADRAATGTRALGYHRLHRLGRRDWWRGPVGLVVLALVLLLLGQLIGLLLGRVAEAAGGDLDIEPVTPWGLAWINLAWAAAIPMSMLVLRALHGLGGGWLASVVGRIRWGWLLRCLGWALVALVATLAVALVVPEQAGTPIDSSANDVTDRVVAFVLVIVLLTPLQAAGEEYAFRGYLTQACGGLVTDRYAGVVAVAVPALLFALAHGAQDPPVFVDRLAFGLVAGTLVVLTGGLEAGIAMHVLNNWFAFGLTLAFGDIDSALAPQAGTWWTLPGTLTQSLVYLGLVVWSARRNGVEAAVPPGILEASGRRR